MIAYRYTVQMCSEVLEFQILGICHSFIYKHFIQLNKWKGRHQFKIFPKPIKKNHILWFIMNNNKTISLFNLGSYEQFLFDISNSDWQKFKKSSLKLLVQMIPHFVSTWQKHGSCGQLLFLVC
jgi:hypothetical protein